METKPTSSRRLATTVPRDIVALLTPLVLTLAIAACGGDDAHTNAAMAAPAPAYPAWESRRLFAFPGTWEETPAVTVRTIYPAQASWQFVTGPEHSGRASVEAGTPCAACHGNTVIDGSSVAGWAGPPADHKDGSGCQACHGVVDQRIESLGEELVDEHWLEDDPIAGKRPAIDVEVRAAYDGEYLYMRFSWDAQRPGITHDLLRWDGDRWNKWGGPKPDAPKQGILPSYEDRVAILIDDRHLAAYDGAQVTFAQAGCWIACHDSMRKMPAEPTVDAVKADPYLGGALAQQDVRKYLLNTRAPSRTRSGWSEPKSAVEIDRLLAAGDFVDLLMWRASRSGPIGYADDFYVSSYRLRDEGKGPFATQKEPAYMYDAQTMGFNAIPETAFEEMLDDFALIEGENAVPLDPGTAFATGDIISRRVLRTPAGSAADILVNGWWENGSWTTELRRKLDTGHADDKAFEVGRIYHIGVAIFDDMVSNRRHHVSFPVTLGIGVTADIVAVPLDGTDDS